MKDKELLCQVLEIPHVPTSGMWYHVISQADKWSINDTTHIQIWQCTLLWHVKAFLLYLLRGRYYIACKMVQSQLHESFLYVLTCDSFLCNKFTIFYVLAYIFLLLSGCLLALPEAAARLQAVMNFVIVGSSECASHLLRVSFISATWSIQPLQGHVGRYSADCSENIGRVYNYYLRSLSLLAVNCFVKPACAGFCHFWPVTTCNCMSKCLNDWSRTDDNRLIQNPSVLTLLPACPLFE
jgi:hypothetical protein